MNAQEIVGRQIKKLREEQCLSQTELAHMVGYKDKTAIAKIEAGKVDLPQSKISAFAQVFKTEISYLFDTIPEDGGVRMPELKDILKVLRSENNMSQADLAQKLSCGLSTIASWEVGTRFPRKAYMEKLADIFDVNIDYLYGRTDLRQSFSEKQVYSVGERIRQKRKECGLTQEDLAQRLGIKNSAVAKYENGRIENIKRCTILKMSEIFSCSPAYLLGLDDSESPNLRLNSLEKKVLFAFRAADPVEKEMVLRILKTE